MNSKFVRMASTLLKRNHHQATLFYMRLSEEIIGLSKVYFSLKKNSLLLEINLISPEN